MIGHGAINGIAGISTLVIRGMPNPLLGPTPVGLIGSFGFTLICVWLFWRAAEPSKFRPDEHQPIKAVTPE